MRLDHLTIALRPRPARQALDLGFALLQARAAEIYKAWLALWLPLIAVAGALTIAMPDLAALWLLLPWWLRPLLERGPLYVMSRQVFGEDVSWRGAVRAWPGQLGGGWVRMLTWWRPFMAGRGLYQPVWQLEQARGAAASQRRAVIARKGTGRAAYMFGVACAHFEGVLQLGMLSFVGMFISDNQFSTLAYLGGKNDGLAMQLLPLACYAIGGAIIGPIYVACCFTLYLNRRATLEAWDIELTLRQIQAPAARRQGRDMQERTTSTLLLLAAPLAALMLALLLSPAPALAGPPATPAAAAASPPPPFEPSSGPCGEMPVTFTQVHAPARDPGQQTLHEELRAIYDSDELRGYDCELAWRLKGGQPKRKPEAPHPPRGDYSLIALLLKTGLIATAIGLAVWLLYRYRDRLLALLPKPAPIIATEIAGLDIRAESLPDDIPAAVRRLWHAGEQRGALALLYRATLSRLVQRHGLQLAQGATEGDCLRQVAAGARRGQLGAAQHEVAATVTDLWLNGAYGGRWPDSAAVERACTVWPQQFDATKQDTTAGSAP